MQDPGRGKRHMKPASLPPKTAANYYYHPFEFAVCGFSGSGKTTLLEKLIPALAAQGISTAYMKHDAHIFDMDVDGKDTARAWQAGAQLSAIQSPEKNALLSRGRFAAWPTQAAAANADILLIEGNKHSDIPKLFMLDERGEGLAEFEAGSIPNLAAVLTQSQAQRDELAQRFPQLSFFLRDNVEGIAAFLQARLAAAAPALEGVVLVGGKSQRMGTDKAALEIGGRSQARRMADLLAPHCRGVWISCRPGQEIPEDAAHLPRIFDSFQNLGPLGGILSAQKQIPDAALLVVACDLPLLEAQDLETLIAARNPLRHASAYTGQLRGEKIIEPLCTIYEPAFYALGLAALARGISCPRRALGSGRVSTLEPRSGALTNANTAQEWQEGLLKRKELGQSALTPQVPAAQDSPSLPRHPYQLDELLAQQSALLADKLKSQTELVSWQDAPGRILAQDILADLDQPPFDRAAMDGIAVAAAAVPAAAGAAAATAADTTAPAIAFQIVGLALAGGSPDASLAKADSGGLVRAVEIQTGAALPPGFDTVIRLEDLEYSKDRQTAQLHAPLPKLGANVHRQGSDYRVGQTLERSGAGLGAGHLPLLTSLGINRVRVRRRPRVSILATGSELVDPSQKPGPGQIRSSNVETVSWLAKAWGIELLRAERCVDERAAILAWVETALRDSDAVILTGGVSKGRTDYVPGIAEELGGITLVKGLNQRPGKPLFVSKFDKVDAGPATLLFGLPGNPVSAMVNCRRYILPSLCFGAGTAAALTVSCPDLPGTMERSPDMTYFVAVRLSGDYVNGLPVARVLFGNGSGDFSHLATSDGFVEMPASSLKKSAGLPQPLYKYYAWLP